MGPVAVGDSITTNYAEYDTVAFRAEGVTSPAGSYVIKKLGVPANNEVVSVGGGYLNIAYASATAPSCRLSDHIYIVGIKRDTCGTSSSTTHGLFTHAHSPPSFLSQLVTCSAAAPNQRFQFWTV
ncbi:hypothetical protein DXG03_002520 [Asterophora parasitica]|uniref:Uncharacterized protein n=1 Tax=Asterophora parasitica TaxID=117018 RepID=A0A9P7K8N2_9AGAR|nr:hypothetical protein DXG03_002520 [Asterophora parasitica]